MIKLIAPDRGTDTHGSGHFGASRGNRPHNGIDFAAWPGSKVLSNIAGDVTRLGYPYGDDLSFRYVEITDGMGNKWRYFYTDPSVELSQRIAPGDIIGIVQDLDKRYKGITPHIHLEIKNRSGEFVDPGQMTTVANK